MSIGWGADLQSSRLVQRKSLNALRSYSRNIKIRVGVNCHLTPYIYIHYITVTLLNNSVELSSNLNPEPLKSGLRTPLLTQSY